MIKRLYQDAGLLPADDYDRSLGPIGFQHIVGIKRRIEVPLNHTPGVVQFGNDQDPETMRMVTTYSKRKSPEVVLRFFVVPTKEPMTTGILKDLPWLPSRAGMFILGAGKWDDSQDRNGIDVTAYVFLDRMTREKFASENRAKETHK